MRRLPIYFLIDVSESMVGEPIQQVEEGLSTIIQALKTDPVAIETVWISVIIFAGQAKTIVPLQEIINFYPPKLPIGSGTSLSKGLGHLMFEMRRSIVKTTVERKGDWKPIIFLFTDGVPTDNTKAVIDEWKQNWQRSANMVAVSFGAKVNLPLLNELTENVLHFNNTDAAAYKQFFKWVTDSVKTSSASVDNNSTGFELAKINNDTLSKIELLRGNYNESKVDENFVVLAAKCQNTKRPYLMKYKKTLENSGFTGISSMSYRLVGAYQVNNEYFELSEENSPDIQINTDELIGAPTCPCCGNQFAFAVCSCGKLHCIGFEQTNICPWCGCTGEYGMGSSGFNVNRTQG